MSAILNGQHSLTITKAPASSVSMLARGLPKYGGECSCGWIVLRVFTARASVRDLHDEHLQAVMAEQTETSRYEAATEALEPTS